MGFSLFSGGPIFGSGPPKFLCALLFLIRRAGLCIRVWGGWGYRDGPGAGYVDGPRLLRMRLGGLVPLVGVELGWGLASLLLLRSLAWNCALGVGWLAPSPGVYGVGGGCALTGSTRWHGIALLGLASLPRCTRWRGIALLGLGGWPPPLGLG